MSTEKNNLICVRNDGAAKRRVNDDELRMLEDLPTKVRRIGLDLEIARQELVAVKSQMTVKDGVIEFLTKQLLCAPAAPVVAPAPAPVVVTAPVAPAPAPVVVTAPVAPAPAPVVVPAPAALKVKAMTTTPAKKLFSPAPMASPPKVVKQAAAAKVVAAPVAVASNAHALVKKQVVVVQAAPKLLKLIPVVAPIEVDGVDDELEEEEEEEEAAAALDDDVVDEDQEEEDPEAEYIQVQVHPKKPPVGFFYAASTKGLYRVATDGDGDSVLGELVAMYDLENKKILEQYVEKL